jgi:hypothetical protein
MRGKPMKMFEVKQYYKISFSVHHEMMKQFHRLHGKVAMAHPTSVKERDALSITAPLAIKCVKVDSGGSYLPEQSASLRTSLSLPRVASYKLSLN